MPYYRPYVNGAGQTGTTLASDGWPASTTVLWANDKIKIEGGSTEFTVASNATTNSSGQVTISLTTSLGTAPADDTPILVPAERSFSSDMRTSIANEVATLVYFMQFDFVLAKKITGFANAGGSTTTVTSTAHGLTGADTQVKIYGTNTTTDTNYDGTWTISNINTDNFRIPTAFITETGSMVGGFSADRPIYLCTAPHNMSWDSKTWVGIGGNIGFEAITETTELSGHGITQILSGVEQSIISSVLNYTYYGRYARTWLAHINSSGTIVDTPKLIFWGRMNGGFEITEDREENRPGSVTVRGRFVDRFGELQLIRGIQSNEESHQRFFPTDTFFKHVHVLMNQKIIWGPASGSK